MNILFDFSRKQKGGYEIFAPNDTGRITFSCFRCCCSQILLSLSCLRFSRRTVCGSQSGFVCSSQPVFSSHSPSSPSYKIMYLMIIYLKCRCWTSIIQVSKVTPKHGVKIPYIQDIDKNIKSIFFKNSYIS